MSGNYFYFLLKIEKTFFKLLLELLLIVAPPLLLQAEAQFFFLWSKTDAKMTRTAVIKQINTEVNYLDEESLKLILNFISYIKKGDAIALSDKTLKNGEDYYKANEGLKNTANMKISSGDTEHLLIKETGTAYSAKDQLQQNLYRTLKLKTKVKNHKLLVTLPDSFEYEHVEVSISPIHEIKKTRKWKEDFENISVWDVNEDDFRMASCNIHQY